MHCLSNPEICHFYKQVDMNDVGVFMVMCLNVVENAVLASVQALLIQMD